uniref:VWFA domain-containing protein n=1 Tax=Panagrolaimus sp. JU765 TaxID=591449 RepID=A0AC34R062_9BILA
MTCSVLLTTPCKGAIFIGEMTEVIGQGRKSIFLNATKQIAAYLNANPGPSTNLLHFSIATYGNGTLRPILLQTFSDFNRDLNYLINEVAANNNPNSGQTFTGSILEDLYSVIVTNQLANYLVLFMGETERILDIYLIEEAVQRIASTSAQIFVLDMTTGRDWTNDYFFKELVNNDLTKIYNYTHQNVGEVTNYYTSGKFAQVWNKMTC